MEVSRYPFVCICSKEICSKEKNLSASVDSVISRSSHSEVVCLPLYRCHMEEASVCLSSSDTLPGHVGPKTSIEHVLLQMNVIAVCHFELINFTIMVGVRSINFAVIINLQ